MRDAIFLLGICPKRSQRQLMKLSGQHRLHRSQKRMALNRSKPDGDIERRNSSPCCHRHAATDDMLNQTLLEGAVEGYATNTPRNNVPISPLLVAVAELTKAWVAWDGTAHSFTSTWPCEGGCRWPSVGFTVAPQHSGVG